MELIRTYTYLNKEHTDAVKCCLVYKDKQYILKTYRVELKIMKGIEYKYANLINNYYAEIVVVDKRKSIKAEEQARVLFKELEPNYVKQLEDRIIKDMGV